MHCTRWLGLSVALGLALSASAAVAQDTTSYRSSSSSSSQSVVKFGLGGGVATPVGTFNDGSKLGWQGMAAITFRPWESPVGFQIDGNFMQMSFQGGGGKTQVIDGTANLVFTIPTSEETAFKPYLIGGAGVYNVKANPDAAGVPNRSVTKFGINGGAGFDIGRGPAVFFVEGRFHNVFSGTINNIGGTSSASLIPVTIGIRFGGQ